MRFLASLRSARNDRNQRGTQYGAACRFLQIQQFPTSRAPMSITMILSFRAEGEESQTMELVRILNETNL